MSQSHIHTVFNVCSSLRERLMTIISLRQSKHRQNFGLASLILKATSRSGQFHLPPASSSRKWLFLVVILCPIKPLSPLRKWSGIPWYPLLPHSHSNFTSVPEVPLWLLPQAPRALQLLLYSACPGTIKDYSVS